MKLSSLSVIFIIIILPIILVFSYYISLQLDTVSMQTTYNTKLLDATKSAIEAFEINTVEWNADYSTVGNSKRRDVIAAVNTFTTSFANAIGVGGTSKENLMAYIPAIAFTLYDGYYIYSPSETKEIIKNKNGTAVYDKDGNVLYAYDSGKGGSQSGVYDGEGIYNGTAYTIDSDYAKSTYTHILKPFISYSARYENKDDDTDVVINYTLDNYITINGKVKGKYENRARISNRYF